MSMLNFSHMILQKFAAQEKKKIIIKVFILSLIKNLKE